MSEERINHVETTLAFQEEALAELTKTVMALQNRVMQLEKTCQFLAEKLKASESKEGELGPQDERPPHY